MSTSGGGTREAKDYFHEIASEWKERYPEKIDLSKRYPENLFRLKLFMDLLAEEGSAQIIDVGCGNGMPMVRLLDAGFDVHGFDGAEDMVAEGARILQHSGHEAERIFVGDLKDPDSIPKQHLHRYDCVTAMGVMPYIKDEAASMSVVRSLLKENGIFIFSMRNELFSLFSQNKYTHEFLKTRLMDFGTLPDELQEKIDKKFRDRFVAGHEPVPKALEKIDDKGVWSRYDNPLEMDAMTKKHGFQLEGMYYYHFHAAPPEFEAENPTEFREHSLKLENPSDWRGMFMASTFVVKARLENTIEK
jgi:2-polyprenyl-3-methyl-5-hydroxy-6-metoxy-1,4-benzoquinol methylase